MRRCPGCGSTKARPSRRSELERWAGFLLLRPYRCRSCDRRFWWLLPRAKSAPGLQPLVPAALALAVLGVVAVYMASLPRALEVEPAGGGVPATPAAEPVPEPDLATSRAPAAPRLFEGVAPTIEDDRVRLRLLTGGRTPGNEHYFLAQPPRFVVDLSGRWTVRSEEPLFLNHPLVRRVRITQPGDRVRVEIELGPVRDDEPEFEEAADGLVITFRRP